MASYETVGQSDEWYTPQYIFTALGLHFDLDVASPEGGPRYVPCGNYYSEGSLEKAWYGMVWMNPPFGTHRTKEMWLNKFIDHGYGIALIPDRTSSAWFQYIAEHADAICFVSPRIKFERPDGSIGKSPGTGTALIAIGDVPTKALINADLGIVVKKHDK